MQKKVLEGKEDETSRTSGLRGEPLLAGIEKNKCPSKVILLQ